MDPSKVDAQIRRVRNHLKKLENEWSDTINSVGKTRFDRAADLEGAIHEAEAMAFELRELQYELEN